MSVVLPLLASDSMPQQAVAPTETARSTGAVCAYKSRRRLIKWAATATFTINITAHALGGVIYSTVKAAGVFYSLAVLFKDIP
jgi:hypothetical protein